MKRFLTVPLAALLLLAGLAGLAASAAAPLPSRAEQIRHKLDDPAAGIFIAAHRGCHNPSPRLGLGATPENSRAALEHCVLLGVDMMELDVRRAGDGTLVVIHDASVDRTTNGHGKVADLTLAQLQALRLKQNFGGQMAPDLSDEHVATLAEMLDAAKGRIMLNLDIKEPAIYADTNAEATAHGMARYVLVKTFVNQDTAAVVSDQAGFSSVPFMPIVGPWQGAAREQGQGQGLAGIVAHQLSGQHRPVGVELVFVPAAQYRAVQQVVAQAGVRLWANTLTSVGVISVIGMGGDLDALRTGGQAWGALFAAGVNTIQTDEPGPLLDYLERSGLRH